jgi:cell division septation protein DedD
LSGVNELVVPGLEEHLVVDLGPAVAPKDTLPPTAIATQPAAPDSTRVAVRAVNASSRFHVIGGCFLMKENAEAFVSNLQARGFAASIIDQKGGLYRVAYGSYPDRELALDALSAVRKEEAPEAWLLVR